MTRVSAAQKHYSSTIIASTGSTSRSLAFQHVWSENASSRRPRRVELRHGGPSGQADHTLGTGKQTRTFCYVDDLIEGLVRLMESPRDFTGPVNLGNPDEFTIKELAFEILRQTNSGSELQFLPLPTDDPKQRRPDIMLAKSMLNWEPVIPLAKGLQPTIEHFSNRTSQTFEPGKITVKCAQMSEAQEWVFENRPLDDIHGRREHAR